MRMEQKEREKREREGRENGEREMCPLLFEFL